MSRPNDQEQYITWLIVIVIAMIALAIRIPVLFAGIDGTSIEFADGATYAIVGDQILAGRGITDWYGPHTLWPPFYSLLIAVLTAFTGDSELGGRLVSLIAGMIAVLFAYLIARRLFSRQSAAFVALVFALDPFTARASLAVLSESTYLSVLLAAIWLSLNAFEHSASDRRHWVSLFGSGVLLACAYLTRPDAILFAAILALVYVVSQIRSSNSWLRAPIGLSWLIAGFAILALPYAVFLHNHTGEWQLSGKSNFNFAVTDPRLGDSYAERYFGLNEDGTVIGLNRTTKDDVVQYWAEHRAEFAKRYLGLFATEYRSWLPRVFHPIMFMLFGIGLFGGQFLTKGWQKLLLFGGFFPLLILPVFHIQLRYLYPVLPFMLIWAGHGSFIVTEELRKADLRFPTRNYRVPLDRIFLVGLVAILIFFYSWEFIRSPYQLGPEERRVGEWIEDNYGPGKRIMDVYWIAAFHADGYPIQLPYAPVNRVLEIAERERTDFLVVSESYSIHPDVVALMAATDLPPTLKKVYGLDPGVEKKIKRDFVVFRYGR